jgi:Tfp pilus assembly protein PilV
MGRLKQTRMCRDQAGIALIDALVSAVVLMTAAAGVFTAFDASTRATAQERHRARANDLAQSDLERIRSLPYACPGTDPNCAYSIISLITPQSRQVAENGTPYTVTSNGTPYTITSRAQFLTETPTTSACVTGPDSRDYLQISSTVTWPGIGSRPAVRVASATSPPSGSVIPNTGSLLVTVTDSRGAGIPGVGFSGSGPAGFNGTTGTSGCVLWRNLPAGTYSMSLSGVAASKVDQNGNSPQAQPVSVVTQATNTVNLQYDTPGSLTVNFKTPSYGNGALINSSADSITVQQTGMNVAKQYSVNPRAFTIGTPTSPAVLFPFPSPYAVFAGTCVANNPDPQSQGSLAVANPIVPVGGAAPTKTIQLPALHLTVRDGTSSSNPQGAPVPNATVTVKDLGTGCGSVTRTMTTNSSGQLADPGLPYGAYEVCASASYGSPTPTQRKNYVRTGSGNPPPKESVPVTDPSAGADRTIYLGTLAAGVTTGSGQVCP